MRILPTFVHGIIDYVWGALLILTPHLLGTPDYNATLIAGVFGAAAILYSLATRYELGAVKLIAMRTHLLLDIAAGVVLVAVPFVLPIDPAMRAVFIGFGLFAVAAGFITRTVPGGRDAVRA